MKLEMSRKGSLVWRVLEGVWGTLVSAHGSGILEKPRISGLTTVSAADTASFRSNFW